MSRLLASAPPLLKHSSRCLWRGSAVVPRRAPGLAGPPAALQRQEREPVQSISVHKGFKIQAALCVERPPTRVLEPEFKKRWRAFKEAWEPRTGNELTVQDEIVFMRFHFHFLGDKAAQRLMGDPQAGALAGEEEEAESIARGALMEALTTGSEARGNLDMLLEGQGLSLAFPQRRRHAARKKRAEQSQAAVLDEGDVHSLQRSARRSLFLLVRYSVDSAWTFPKVDRVHGQAMHEALQRLCGRQSQTPPRLGARFEPYIVGTCPMAHRKLRSTNHAGIKGRKIFYYRARLVPGMDVALPNDSPVADWAWCSRAELPNYLRENEWNVVRDCLPLDDLAF